MIAQMIATMDISRAKDEYGKMIVPPADFEAGSSRCVFYLRDVRKTDSQYSLLRISRPKPFRCTVSPRSSAAVELIKQLDIVH